MSTQQNFSKLSRLIAAMVALMLVFAQVASVAQAQKPIPGKEKAQIAQADLNEVETYYGRLGDVKGPVGIVVELADDPAALIYAESSESQRNTLAGAQAKAIEQKQADLMSAIQSKGIKVTELYRTQKAYNGIWMHVDVNDLKTLASMDGVKAIHPMVPKTIDNSTSVPLIGAPAVWGGSALAQGTGIKIGIIDTGIDYQHVDFGGDVATAFSASTKVVGGWDFAGDAYTGDNTPMPDADPMDTNGHGTHVAGTAAGFGVTADGYTYQESGADTYAALKNLSSAAYADKFFIGPGVAPKADLYALRVFGTAGVTNLTEAAIEWAMDPNGDYSFDDHLDVINMSLGSSFGSLFDPSAVAANNAAKVGIIVVASAGNSGDVNYITGAPASAPLAISVASSVDGGATVSAFEVKATLASSPLVPVGIHPAAEQSEFGPQEYNVTGQLAVSANYAAATADDGCVAYPADTFKGKIALIKRGTCSIELKVRNGQNAGAIGVLIGNNTAAFPNAAGADTTVLEPTIPSMMTTMAIGNDLKTDAAKGAITVKLTTDYHNGYVMLDPSLNDTLSSFSSRGVARGGTRIKPDITAPGDSIFSAAMGTEFDGAGMSGTSMASPHVAGVMALLKQIHPTWSVAELKALAMNTATNDLFTGVGKTGTKYTPSRVGAGRVDVATAAASLTVAYGTGGPGQVSLSFGEQAVLGIQTLTASITVANKGTADATYTVGFDSRYADNPGLAFTALPASVTVAAGGKAEVVVTITADASKLTKALDPTLALGSRQRFSEGGGYVTLTSSTVPSLRVPVHIAARPASDMTTVEKSVFLPAASTTGTILLTPFGTPTVASSFVSIMGLMGTSPNDAWTAGIQDAADIQYIGATSDYPAYTYPNAWMYFGISTYGKWDTLNSVEFDVYIDKNEDGIYDYVIYNYNSGTDTMLTAVANLQTNQTTLQSYVNGFSGSTNTTIFNNNVVVLPVPFGSIGVLDGVNSDFNFYVASYSREYPSGAADVSGVMSYNVANQAITAVNPANGMPMWYDNAAAGSFVINYNKDVLATGGTKGVLLLHHDNHGLDILDTTVTTPQPAAQVVPVYIPKTISFASVAAYDGWVLESGEKTNKGRTLNKTATTILVGDNAKKQQYMGILSFKAALPTGAIITKATLMVRYAGVVGPIKAAKMFTTFKGLSVDTRKPSFGTIGLTATDFQATGTKNVAKFGVKPVAGWYSAPINKAYITKLGTMQFRLHFMLDDNNNTKANYLKFYSGNSKVYKPQLVIEYYIP